MAVGTNAALKAVDFPAADAAGQQLVFANTYHLLLQPGSDVMRDAVRERYDGIARATEAGCGCDCGPEDEISDAAVASIRMGYSQAELDALPDGSDLGLGCGNPQAIAALQPGETVLDLGSGAGIDCFLAARQVSGTGHVIGVDMTASMIARARQNAAKE